MKHWIDFMLGEKELARRCAELMSEVDQLREQVDGLRAALEMREVLLPAPHVVDSIKLQGFDTLHLKDLPSVTQLRIKVSSPTTVSVSW